MDPTIPALIGGERVESTNSFEVVDPSTGEAFRHAARCGYIEIERAVAAARETFEGSWRRTSTRERARMMKALAGLILRERSELATMESRDTGKPLSQALADADLAARYFEFYGDCIEALYGDTIPISDELHAFTLREPYGVTGHIIPWNYPLQIGARTVAAALAAGNCCVLKPAEEAPSTPFRLGELALEAGLPPGALNVVPGLGDEAGAALASHSGIDHLAFTGSVEIGRTVAKSAAENTIPVTLELGGKSPNIVFADATLDDVFPVVVNSIIQNAGQTCSAGSRLLVDETVHDVVVEEIARRFREISIGPGINDPDLGPLISGAQLERVKSFVKNGKEQGRLVVGGDVPAGGDLDGGFFHNPTLFDHVPPTASIGQEEVFGPVLTATSFSDLDEAAALANATDYGLVAAVWTKDINKAHRLAREIRAGQIFINTYGAGGSVETPFGGYKSSGYGREKGFEALLGYTQTKSVVIRLGS